MLTPNDLKPYPAKPFPNSVKDKLRLPLPLEPSGEKSRPQACKESESRVLPAPGSSSSEVVFAPAELTQSQEFKPSPRFPFSSESSESSEYVPETDEPSINRLKIPSKHEFTLARSNWEDDLANKERLLQEAKASERKLEARLSECLQSTARVEGELRFCQQRNKSLMVDIETAMAQISVKTTEMEKLANRLAEKDREVAQLQLKLQAVTAEGKTQKGCELASATEKARQDNSDLQMEITRLRSELARKDGNLEKLQSRLKKLKRKARASVDGDQSQFKENILSPTAATGSLFAALKVSNCEEAVRRVEELRAKERQLKHCEDFTKKLQEIIVACSPPEAFKTQPSLSDMWRWVRRLVEEYMSLRKQPEALRQCCSLLHSPEANLVPSLQRLVSDYEDLLIGLSRVKAKLRLPMSANVKDVAQALESRIS